METLKIAMLGLLAGIVLIIAAAVLLVFLYIAEKIGWLYYKEPGDTAYWLTQIATALTILGGGIAFGSWIFISMSLP